MEKKLYWQNNLKMSRKLKETDIRNSTNKIKIDEKLYKKILICYIGCVTINSAKILYLIIDKINGYIEECNGINICC